MHGWRAVLASFLVLFAAEWGDLSQLLTISLVAKYEDAGRVFIGALAALLLVSGLAVVAGRQLLRFVKLHVLHYVGAGVCLLLARRVELVALSRRIERASGSEQSGSRMAQHGISRRRQRGRPAARPSCSTAPATS